MLRTTNDKLVSAPVPDEPGWSVEEVCGAAAGPTVTTVLKCKRTVPGEFLFFLAKEYSVPPPDVRDAETLVRSIFAGSYQKMFTQVKYDHVGPVQAGGATWVEAAMQMLHPKLGALAKLERVCCVGNHVLVVSVEGLQPVLQRHWPAASAWLAGAAFARLAAGT